MSVTITKTPPALALIGEPMIFRFVSGNINNPAFTPSYAVFAFSFASLGVGMFTFRNAEANVSINYYPQNGTFKEQFEAIPYFAENYTITSPVSTVIVVIAKKYGAKYNIIAFNYPAYVVDYEQLQGITGTDYLRYSFFRYKVSVYKYDVDGSVRLMGSDYITPDEDGYGTVNIADYLKNEAYSSLVITEGNAIREATGNVIKYDIEVEETSNDSAFTADNPVYAAGYNAMWGGLGYIKQAIFNQTDSSWFTEYANLPLKKFLTYSPTTKTVSTAQRERLFFLNIFETSLVLKCKITYEDGSFLQKTIYTESSPKTYTAYALHVGYSELALLADELSENPIAFFEVWVENASAAVSETRKYVVDRKYYTETRYLYSVNSLGGWETLRLNQSITDNSAFERTVNSYVVADNYTLHTQATRTQTKRTDSVEASAGWLSKQAKVLMRELLMSRKVFEDVGTAVPTIVNFINTEISDNNKEYLKTETLSYARAFDEDWYSDEIGNLAASNGYFENYFVSYFE